MMHKLQIQLPVPRTFLRLLKSRAMYLEHLQHTPASFHPVPPCRIAVCLELLRHVKSNHHTALIDDLVGQRSGLVTSGQDAESSIDSR